MSKSKARRCSSWVPSQNRRSPETRRCTTAATINGNKRGETTCGELGLYREGLVESACRLSGDDCLTLAGPCYSQRAQALPSFGHPYHPPG